jgi:hypothetical protein
VFIVMVNGLWFMLGIIEVYLQIWYRCLTPKVDDNVAIPGVI